MKIFDDEDTIQYAIVRFWKAMEIYRKSTDEKEINVLTFLTKMFVKLYDEKKSLLGIRVKCYNDKCDITEDENDTYKVDFSTDLITTDERMLKNIEVDKNEKYDACYVIKSLSVQIHVLKKDVDTKYVKDYFKNLVECGINGFLISVFDKENLTKYLTKATKQPPVESDYECDECRKHFKTAKGFLNHLKKEKHHDKIYEQFGYWDKEYLEE